MTTYSRHEAFGLVVESDRPLPSLPRYRGDRPADVCIVEADADYFRSKAPATMPDTGDWVRQAVLADGGVYLRAENVLEVTVSSNGRMVVCRRIGEVDARSVEANLVNFALSTSLTLMGEEPLHATAIAAGGRAVGLLGRSGAGKSTLAAFLIARGAELLTDDMLRLHIHERGDVYGFRGPCRLKLFEETGRRILPEAVVDGHFNPLSGKFMVRPSPSAAEATDPCKLSALVHLDPPDDAVPPGAAVLERLRGGTPVRTLISSAMDDRSGEALRLRRQFAFATRLAGAIPIYSLRYHRTFEMLPIIAEKIERLVHQ